VCNTLSEVRDLVHEFREVDERVAVVLPVEEDVVTTVELDTGDGIVLVPLAEIGFHGGCHVPFVVTRALAASPLFPVCNREVEVGAAQITLKVVSSLETVAHGGVGQARSDLGIVSADIGLCSLLDIAEGQVAAKAVDFTIRRPKFEEIGLGRMSLTESSEPGFRP